MGDEAADLAGEAATAVVDTDAVGKKDGDVAACTDATDGVGAGEDRAGADDSGLGGGQAAGVFNARPSGSAGSAWLPGSLSSSVGSKMATLLTAPRTTYKKSTASAAASPRHSANALVVLSWAAMPPAGCARFGGDGAGNGARGGAAHGLLAFGAGATSSAVVSTPTNPSASRICAWRHSGAANAHARNT